MKSKVYAVAVLLTAMAMGAGCSGGKDAKADNNEDYTADSAAEVYTPHAGTPLEQLCDVPGIGWCVDTIYGVCVPDTMVLWAVYDDRYLPTNVRGAEMTFVGLTDKGINAIKTDSLRQFIKTDFTAEARLLDNLDYSRTRMRHDADSLLEKRVGEMITTASDFFTSYGMTKYMSKPMANNWIKVNADAELQGVEPPNPINGSNQIEFEPGTVSVIVDDAQKGEVRVKAYCLDVYTLSGRQGWAYWRMTMCKEGRYFKVKTPPILHKPGNDSFYEVD